jgi:hypothetical protein
MLLRSRQPFIHDEGFGIFAVEPLEHWLDRASARRLQEMVVCFPDIEHSPTFVVSLSEVVKFETLVGCHVSATHTMFADFNNDGLDDVAYIWEASIGGEPGGEAQSQYP